MTRLFCCFMLLLSIGCGQEDSLNRVHLQGSVTFKGNPVPVGVIVFEPDSALGGGGPQGYATIENGKFDTSANGGKPVLPGPLVVQIHGFDGKNPTGMLPHGTPIFSNYKTKYNASKDSKIIDFEVPANTK